MTLPEDFLVSTTTEALQTRLAAYLASPAGARTSGLEPVPFITLELLLKISKAIAACSTAERGGAKQKVVACFVARDADFSRWRGQVKRGRARRRRIRADCISNRASIRPRGRKWRPIDDRPPVPSTVQAASGSSGRGDRRDDFSR